MEDSNTLNDGTERETADIDGSNGDEDEDGECARTPRCPYECPYKPSKAEQSEIEGSISSSEIEQPTNDRQPTNDTPMTAIIRTSDYEGDVHVAELFETDFGRKVGIISKPEYSDVFNELDWDTAHHKWDTERTKGTDMWEVDLDALLYVTFHFLKHDVDVTVDDDIREAYLEALADG